MHFRFSVSNSRITKRIALRTRAIWPRRRFKSRVQTKQSCTPRMKFRLLTVCRVSWAVWNDLITTLALPGLSKPNRKPVIVPFQLASRYTGIIVRFSPCTVITVPPPPPMGMNVCGSPSGVAGAK